ncbi:MAG: hypothetical protein IJ325_05455 [Clostridia bacterium]|nr:hypothetical protein [Clostridia bacterium]
MKNINKILFIGGDARSAVIAERLGEIHKNAEIVSLCTDGDRGEVFTEKALAEARDADVLILPLPLTNDGENMTIHGTGGTIPLRPFLEKLPPGKQILGGQIPYFYKRLIEECGSSCGDYFDSEVVQLRNAIPTAEGAIGVAISELPVTIAGCPIVVTGYGRCGYTLAARLRLLGADVTVAVRRREAQVMAEGDGCRSISIRELQEDPPACRMLFNTIPAPILSAETLQKFRKDCILVELASGTGESMGKEAEKAGLRFIKASGLPGKTAPETAGNILAESILEWINDCRGDSVCPKN